MQGLFGVVLQEAIWYDGSRRYSHLGSEKARCGEGRLASLCREQRSASSISTTAMCRTV